MNRHSGIRLIIVGIGVVVLAVLARSLRTHLANIADPNLAPWAVQIIFGYYLAIFVISIRNFSQRLCSRSTVAPWQSLLLLLIVCASADLVLNNVREAVSLKLDASYGPVVLWDTVTFFVWLKALDLCEVRHLDEFLSSWVVATVPLWYLGREILWLPFGEVKPYIDIFAANGAMSCWYFVCLARGWGLPPRSALRRRLVRGLILSVGFGCAYSLTSSLEEVLYLAYRPLHDWGVATLERASLPLYSTNVGFVVTSVLIVTLGGSLNPWGIADRLGLRMPGTDNHIRGSKND